MNNQVDITEQSLLEELIIIQTAEEKFTVPTEQVLLNVLCDMNVPFITSEALNKYRKLIEDTRLLLKEELN